MKVNIHCPTADTRDAVVVNDSGDKIENIVGLSIQMDPNSVVIAELTMIPAGVNIIGHSHDVTFICPLCDHNISHNCVEQKLLEERE